MPTMCSLIARGVFLEDLEAYLADSNRRLIFLGALGETKSLVAALDKVGLIKSPEMRDHLQQDWVGDRWWPWMNKESVLRHALITLVLKAQQFGATPCIRWICGGSQFQCHITRTPHDIVLILFTPPVPLQGMRVPADVPDDSWVISDEVYMKETVAKAKWVGNGCRPVASDCTLLDADARTWCTPVFSDKRPL